MMHCYVYHIPDGSSRGLMSNGCQWVIGFFFCQCWWCQIQSHYCYWCHWYCVRY